MAFKLLNEAITSVRNAALRGKPNVTVNKSNFVSSVLRVLQKEGYIGSFEEQERTILINLLYFKSSPVFRKIRLISTSGGRVYTKKITSLPRNFGIRIVSTSKGVMSHMEAIEQKIGGELLVEVI